MPKNALASPQDSLQQSTREPSTRLSDRTSLDTSTHSVRRFLTGSSQMGGGSYKSYLMEHLARMHADIEQTTRKLELEQRRLYNLDKNLSVAEAEWSTKRARFKTAQSAIDQSVGHKENMVRALERNLVKSIEELNKGNSENELLREEIDKLRKERTILDSVFKTMAKDITSNEKLLEKEKMKMSENKFASEEAKQKTRALNKMLERERRVFKDGTRKMQKELFNESEVQKEQDNLHRFSSMMESGSGKGKNRRAYMVADEEEAFSEPQMHRRILKLSFLNTIQRRHIKQHQKNIEVFEQAFATIKSSTGISDIEEIVKIFIGLEQRNFSLLTYVNELNRDIENIEICNRDLQDQLKNYQQDQSQSAVRKEDALSELSLQIQKTKAAIEEKDKMIEDSAAALADSRPLILKIVNFLKQEMPGCLDIYEGDPPPMKVAVPDDHEENINNLLMYIEEAILQFRVSLGTDGQQAASLRPQPPRVPPQRAVRPSEFPSAHIAGDDSDDDPDTGLGDRPWTRTELRDRAQANIQRRKRKQHGKLIGDEKRTEAAEDASPAVDRAAPPPAKEYAASSIASRESKEVDSGGTSLSKSPTMSSKQPGDAPTEGARADDDGARADRPENWWRGQGKEKGR